MLKALLAASPLADGRPRQTLVTIKVSSSAKPISPNTSERDQIGAPASRSSSSRMT